MRGRHQQSILNVAAAPDRSSQIPRDCSPLAPADIRNRKNKRRGTNSRARTIFKEVYTRSLLCTKNLNQVRAQRGTTPKASLIGRQENIKQRKPSNKGLRTAWKCNLGNRNSEFFFLCRKIEERGEQFISADRILHSEKRGTRRVAAG